ncbi:MAG TPA: hypothetical protein DG761_06985 [Gammaproteobacteria bacterium]|jgi:polyferredoxin|nr:hypothetical protein [Acidiferrobacteraceae bacterium]MDP6552215.1 4Fe-4S binding protein [Arenicellales bacterium]MDP6792000.1 4Fe-4S binding protein [Arenicellales bacterium]MDP6920000.1 4Fe-4S binding protein [Arenicellales bacterium]HCX87752.1 hypothetical protein [Gammaproteobacteria bacterium]|tara:strand:+ start:107 stop:1633 length:1527 start_codon:yes stop_codon:yes gene_type:complete
MVMTHPGLPQAWAIGVWLFMIAVTVRAILVPAGAKLVPQHHNIAQLPVIGDVVRLLTRRTWPLITLKILLIGLFLLIIISGLFGTAIPERNIATVLTWNLWWTGLIISVFFVGSAWCAVCPWETLSTWMVRLRQKAIPSNSLNLRVPKELRNVWPALVLLIGLTWLELGVGITVDPYATALLALFMVVLAVVTLAVFERRAFCRYLCPVGRTVGFYSQLAPIELRPIDTDTCSHCTSLACYHGDEHTEPCPTSLMMGTLQQNTYCTSCGNCIQSCPHDNIAWRLRSPSIEAIHNARPHWDEAWFMLSLLALTVFHGLTMLSFWEEWISALAGLIGDSNQLLWSFSIGMVGAMAVPVLLYTVTVKFTQKSIGRSGAFKQVFSTLAFVSLPLAFAYHLAHNLTHLVREGDGLSALFFNPLGVGTVPLSMAEKHARHMDLLLPQDVLFTLQAMLLAFGFWVAVKVIFHRGRALLPDGSATRVWQLSPVLVFAVLVTGFNLWLLMQPMTMRM